VIGHDDVSSNMPAVPLLRALPFVN